MNTHTICHPFGRFLRLPVVLFAAVAVSSAWGQVTVTTTAELVSAVNSNPPGTTVNVAAGTYALPSTLRLKSGMSLIGAGAGQTIIRNAPGFALPAASWYDADVNFEFSNPNAYLIDLGRDQANLTVRNLTLTGPEVYGGIHYIACNNVTISGVEFINFRWSGIRGFIGDNLSITNNRFLDAGGQTVNADGSFGNTGGSMFISYMGLSLIDNNRFERSGTRPDNVFGIKGREFRNTRISNNTIHCDFAIELPFENDYYVDIDNNFLDGVVSVPRYAGGLLPPTGATPYTFRIRNNYFTKSYSIEGPHNGMIVERNVFDFPVDSDYGNLFSTFDPGSDTPAAPGPLDFNNNIVINPGRGVFWSDAVWNNLSFTNNHIQANEITPSQYPEGLFSFRDSSPAMGGQVTNYSTITIASNKVEVFGQARGLIRYSNAYAANIFNNQLINVSDAGTMTNPQTGATRGLLTPLNFNVGVNGEFHVNGAAMLLRASATPLCNAGPGVAAQPLPQLIAAGSTVALLATTTPAVTGVFVQWRRNGVSIDDGLGGASPGGGTVSHAFGLLPSPSNSTPLTLTITSAQPSDSGVYTAFFSNACGSITSLPATLTVGGPQACAMADVASDSLDVVRNPNNAIGAEDLDAFIAGFIADNVAIADVASDSLDMVYSPNGAVGPEDLDAFIASFIAGC